MLLVSGRFCLSKTIIPEAQEHFLTPLARRDTHPFGGLGLRQRQVSWCCLKQSTMIRFISGNCSAAKLSIQASTLRLAAPSSQPGP